jgi:glucose/arabinose dehydrogenase
MTAGAHQLQLAAVLTNSSSDAESPRSPSITLVMTSNSTSQARASSLERTTLEADRAADGTGFVLETLATTLAMPSAIAMLPDGALLIAEAAGDVRVWRNGALLPGAALRLTDAVAATDAGLIGMTVSPEFSINDHVFLAYTARQSDRYVNRIVRVRRVEDTLREPVVLLQDEVREPPARTPRLRFGHDRKLYVSFPAGSDRTASQILATYAGKILRLNEDGTTPAENPGHSPILSGGHRVVVFDWAFQSDPLYRIERGWDGVDVLLAGLAGDSELLYRFDAVIDPSNVAFYGGDAVPGFRGDLFVASLNGQHIQRTRFDKHSPARIVSTERLVDRRFGRISDVVSAPDGRLYFSTANATGGSVRDRLIRVNGPSG